MVSRESASVGVVSDRVKPLTHGPVRESGAAKAVTLPGPDARGFLMPPRFWKHVNKTDSCWLWLGGLDRKGYGRFRFDGTHKRAHRIIWASTHGKIPDGLMVCHSCDVRHCVNPAHLFLGTAKHNAEDRDAKGRFHRHHDERHPRAKLTPHDVAFIRSGSGLMDTEIARVLHVHPRTIGKIRRHERWRG